MSDALSVRTMGCYLNCHRRNAGSRAVLPANLGRCVFLDNKPVRYSQRFEHVLIIGRSKLE
jgi:hypothetical protein